MSSITGVFAAAYLSPSCSVIMRSYDEWPL